MLATPGDASRSAPAPRPVPGAGSRASPQRCDPAAHVPAASTCCAYSAWSASIRRTRDPPFGAATGSSVLIKWGAQNRSIWPAGPRWLTSRR